MVAYNFTLDDTSPVIQYTGSWLRKHPEDTKLGMYFSKSFTSSTKKGETAQLRFNGTGIWAYGSKRWNHGKFQVDLDGATAEVDGYEKEPGTIQAVLFSRTGLEQGKEHVLTLTNGEDKWFDVDYYVVQHEDTDGSNELELKTTILDAPSPDVFTYVGKWNTDYKGAEYDAATAALAYDVGDSVAFTFTGTSVAVYGAVNSNHGAYTVTCDGVSSDYSGFYDAGITGGAVMFHRAGLENTEHTVTLINKGAKPTNVFGIDYVQWNYTVPGSNNGDVAGNLPVPVPVAGVVSVASPPSSALKLTSSSAAATSFPSVMGIESVMLKAPTGVLTPAESTMSTASTTSSTSDAPAASASAAMGGAEQVTGHTREGPSTGMLAGIIVGGVAGVILLALLVWFVIRRRRRKEETIYPWNDQRRLAGPGSANDQLSPMTITGSPLSPYQDTPFGGRHPNAAWATTPSPQMSQRDPFATGAVLALPMRPQPPGSNATSYYPYAQSVSPPTEAGDPPTAQTQRTHSTERAYSGMSPASPFHHTAPSSGAIPSDLGDAEIRVASYAGTSHPNILSLPSQLSSRQMSGLSPYMSNTGRSGSARSQTPTSSDGDASFGRRKQGAALPLTSRQPSSVLSANQLSQIRMIVEGRLQDWGPVSLPGENILPPDYSQATEPLPGQVPDDRYSSDRF